MAENDIYNNKARYEDFKKNLKELLIHPDKRKSKRGNKPKYYCRSAENLKYFKILFDKFEARDMSYVRRNRLIISMKVIVYVAKKDLKDLTRDDVDEIMRFANQVHLKSRTYFIRDFKFIWRQLFPEKDGKYMNNLLFAKLK